MSKSYSLKDRIKLIHEAGKNGHIFSILFTKKDGTKRKMVCRLGVTKHLRGGDDSTAHIDKYINVYDLQKEGYRKVNAETLEELHYDGKIVKL